MKSRAAVSRSLPAVALFCFCSIEACSKPAPPPPAPAPRPTITHATFEPVYRASKAIQGATVPGVTYVKFGELLQGLATEIGIAKDHEMNGPDKELIALYEEALSIYRFSAKLWDIKNSANDEMWKGEIPVVFKEKGRMRVEAEVQDGLTKYGLVPADRKVRLTGAEYQALPVDAIQALWQRADDILKRATDAYYGRNQQKPSTPTANH